MLLKTLSATSALVFELCEARWRAEKIDWASSPGSKAAGLGTVCHGGLENFVASGYRDDDADCATAMKKFYTEAYEAQFADRAFFDEGLDLVLKWMHRQVWTGREVLSTEVKQNFELPTSLGPVPFNYVWDRCDQLADGSIEIVDYKSNQAPLTHEQLQHNIQARAYALAAQIRFPAADMIWVTFDYLRHQPVGVRFTKAENQETYVYLRRLAERIIASLGTDETLNDQCKWCVRRHACGKLKDHIKVGGPLGITDPVLAANRRLELEGAKQALEVMIQELDQVLLDHMDTIGESTFDTGETKVSLTISSRRHLDDRAASTVIGDALMAKYGGLTMASVDELLKKSNHELTDDQKSELRRLIYPKLGKPSIKTEKVSVI